MMAAMRKQQSELLQQLLPSKKGDKRAEDMESSEDDHDPKAPRVDEPM